MTNVSLALHRLGRTLAIVLCTGCARRAGVTPVQWTPVPTYAVGPEVGVTCGRAPEALPATITSTVDVLLDSLDRSDLTELRIVVEPVPQWQRARPFSTVGATLIYPKPGVGTPRETFADCDVAKGVTLRVNTSIIARAGLGITSPGPVRITVRSMDGTPLAAPTVLSPGMPMHIVRWASIKRAT
jgi:hypothetical protein